MDAEVEDGVCPSKRPRVVEPPLLERERIDRERAAELAILEWVVSVCEMQEATENMFLVENPVGASSWNHSSIRREFHILCMFGVKDLWSRRALKRPVRYLTNSPQLLKFIVRKWPKKHVHGPVKGLTKNAYACSSRWHTRAWAQAVIRGVSQKARSMSCRRCGNGPDRRRHTR